MNVHIQHESDAGDVLPVRRRRSGASVETISISIPKELNQTINGIVVRDKKSRSLVISELIEKGLKSDEG